MKMNTPSGSVLDRIYETRRANLRALAAPPASATTVGVRLGFTPQYMGHLIGRNPTRTISEKTARVIEEKLGLAGGWLDVAR